MSEEYPEYPLREEQDYEGDGPNLRYDDFVKHIVKDPNDPPGVMLLSGYLGSSSEEACVRLYLDEELSRYVEIPEKAILHTQELPPEQSPLGGSLVWIDRGAEVTHGAAGSERKRATFLEGQIAQDYMGAADAGGYAGLSGSTQTRECVLPATVYGPGCGPGSSKSGPCIPQTEFIGCRTRTGILCTRIGPNCGRTSYDPVCTIPGQHCGGTQVVYQCQSVLYPCVTHDIECQASGYVPCKPPVDFTIWQAQFGPHAAQLGGIGQTGNPCTSYGCTQVTSAQPTSVHACWTTRLCAFGPAAGGAEFSAQQTQTKDCGETAYCPTAYCNYPTLPNSGCPDTRVGACETFAACPSAVDACPTRFGCNLTAFCGESRACRPGGGGPHGFAAAPPQTQSRECVTRLCPSAVDACPTRFNCPSLSAPCLSQYNRCPSLPGGCPGYTRLGPCETFGPCPSAVDACPTRVGCY